MAVHSFRLSLLTFFFATTALAAPTVAMNGHLPSPADSASMKALGAEHVRMDFNWFNFQPTNGAYTFAYLDPIVAAARAQNLSIYATIAYTPKWASSVPSCTQHSPDNALNCDNKRPANVQAWRDAVTAVVTRYRGQVSCWGIWNEPNLHHFFDGTMDQFINDIFLPAAQAIRAADPQGKICGPELAGLTRSSQWNGTNGTCVLGSCIRNGWERDLGQLLTRVGQHLDVVTHHMYKGDGEELMGSLMNGASTAGVLTSDAVKNVVDANGGAGKEFWLTETGWEHPPQGSTSLADVATRIVQVYEKQEQVCAGTWPEAAGRAWPNWTRTYYFHFPYDPGSGWGIVDQTGAALAPYTALLNWTTGRTTTACTGPRATPDGGTGGGGGSMDAGSGGGTGGGGGSIDAGSGGGTGGGGGSIDAGSGGGGTGGGGGSIDAGSGGGTGGGGGGGDPLDGGAGSSAVDGGPGGSTEPAVGCACDATSGPWLLGLLAVAAGLRRRRRA